MKNAALLAMLLGLPATAFAQDFFAYKDLAFAQIAAGGGYETVLNATNRGASSYSGTLTLILSGLEHESGLLKNGSLEVFTHGGRGRSSELIF